jgi:hypothetical protein
MSTRDHRLAISLTPETAALVKSAADHLGLSSSKLIAGLLEDAAPMLKSMKAAAQASKEKRGEVFDHLSEALSMTQIEAGQTQLALSRKRRALSEKKRGKGKGGRT